MVDGTFLSPPIEEQPDHARTASNMIRDNFPIPPEEFDRPIINTQNKTDNNEEETAS